VTRREISPALAGSVALHLVVAAALLISWRYPRDLQGGAAVPVTIVTNAPPGELLAAAPAPETQAAQAEQPAPEAPPEPVPPVPQPSPAPPAPPAPAPAPAKAVEKSKPEPKAKPEQHLDLDALAASVSKLSKPAGGKAASAAKGPAQAATAPETGKALSAAAQASVSGVKDQVERRWNPNCNVAGGRDVKVSVRFRIDSGGQVVGQVTSEVRSTPSEVARAAAERAQRAVYAAAPFRDLPRELYGQSFVLNFDAKDACS
jgi:outer membrane biosynthesis protein TonB